jgi:signal transduction histidine kinase
MNKNDDIFSIILASTVHDMKNSLSMLLGALDTILTQMPEEMKNHVSQKYSVVQYESSRLNTSLMQLLAIYKLDNDQLPFNPYHHNLYDFIEEQVLSHGPLLEAKGFEYEIDIDEDEEVVFDDTLLSMVITNILGNSIRYAKSKILVIATTGEQTTITINDDGPGYPQQMLDLGGNYIKGIDQASGSTGLGLFFAQRIARLHNSTTGIELSNGGELGGGVFKITIP